MNRIDRRDFCLGLGAFSTALVLPHHLHAQTSATSENDQHPVEPIKDTMTQAQRDARMAWWNQARFGMFIHWGLYAAAAGYWNGKSIPFLGEWIMHTAKIPVA
ncbi:MAG: alpha-L-fucosidase, partial [Acidobacteriaceae bacterium]